MIDRIEQKGFKFKGFKLGQKVITEEGKGKIIGFDTHIGDTNLFLYIRIKGKKSNKCNIATPLLSEFMIVTLAGKENKKAGWFEPQEVTLGGFY